MNGLILVVDDDKSMCELIAAGLGTRGYEIRWHTDAASAVPELGEREFDAVITDLELGSTTGLDLCKHVAARRPDLPVVVLTAFGSMDSAVGAIRAGAYDFINKPVDLDTLAVTVGRAIDHHRLRREVKRLRDASQNAQPFEEIIGHSNAIKKVFSMLRRLEDSDAPVLVTGESGTGKELVALALHRRSRHRQGPFVAINCAAVPATLLESTLFGHVRGAFTDARSDKKGLFVEAHRGTLFLDEIGEMPLEMQAKLLRVLQERAVRPVGGSEEIPFDTRIAAATNRDLEEDLEAGRFREDLFYRINVVRVHVPPLRARGNDILLLAQHFLEEAAQRSNKSVDGVSSEAARKLLDYEWPGNVRQLQNVMERAVALTRFDKITIDDLPENIAEYRSTQLVLADDDVEAMPTLDELERRYIQRVLKASAGNKTQAARVLGLDRRTLYRKLERYEKGEPPSSR